MTNLLWTFQEMTFTLTHTFFLLAHTHPRTHIKTRTNNHTPYTRAVAHTHSHSDALIWCLHFLTCILVHRPLSLSFGFSLSLSPFLSLSQHSNTFCSSNFWSYLPLYASPFSLFLSFLLSLFPSQSKPHIFANTVSSLFWTLGRKFSVEIQDLKHFVFFFNAGAKKSSKKRRLWTNLTHKG